MVIENRLSLAKCEALRGRYETAIRDMKQVERMLSGSKYDYIRMRCYGNLSTALEASNHWKESLKYKQLEAILKDSIYDQTIQSRMAIVKVEFEERENQLSIAKQAEIIELNSKVIGQQRRLNIISVSLALVLTGLVIVLYRFNRYQKQISRQLDEKVFERTRELRSSEGALTRALSEQTALMELVSSKVKSSMATFRGLWSIVTTDRCDVHEKFEATASELLQVSSIVDRSRDLRTFDKKSSVRDYSLDLFADKDG